MGRCSAGWGRRNDRGAATTEYIGGIVVAGVVAALVAAAALQAPVPAGVSHAICSMLHVLGGGPCAEVTATGKTDADYKPTMCKIREESEKAGSKVTIGWFSIGKEYGFIEQRFSDGSVRLTMVDSASLGAAAKGGKLFDVGKLGDDSKAKAQVEVAAGLKFGYGDTWSFKNDDEMKKFRDEIEKYEVQRIQAENGGPGYAGVAIWNSITDNWADPPDPTITFGQVSVEASLKGALNLKDVTGPPPAPGKDPETSDPNIGVSFTVKGDYQVVVEHNASAGTTSYTYQVSGTGTAAGSAVVVGGEAAGKTVGAFKVTRNDKGEVTQVSFVSTREGSLQGNKNVKLPGKVGKVEGASGTDGETHSAATVSSATLDVTTPQDRAVVDAWLSGNNEQGLSPLKMTYSTMMPDRPSSDPFEQLMYENAKVSQIGYDNVTDLQKFGAEVNVGFKLGLEVSMENSTSTVDDASYLGAPGDDGTRPMLDYAECS